jgi:hypothetical protein
MATKKELYTTIDELREENATVYYERNLLVALLATIAEKAGYDVGTITDTHPDCPLQWRNVVILELPSGEQISFHMPDRDAWMLRHLKSYPAIYDGHTTEEKYKRIERML